MRAVWICQILGLLVVLSSLQSSEALKCYTCMGSTDEDCNHQGPRECPSYSDACIIVKGQGNGVMKSCSYKSLCNQVYSQGNNAPGVKVHCCYSDDCNVHGHGNSLEMGYNYISVLLLLFWHMM